MPEAGFSSQPAGTVQGTAGRSEALLSDLAEEEDPEAADSGTSEADGVWVVLPWGLAAATGGAS